VVIVCMTVEGTGQRMAGGVRLIGQRISDPFAIHLLLLNCFLCNFGAIRRPACC